VDLTPEAALFVGGFVAFVVWFAAGLAFVAADGLPIAEGFAFALALLGAGFMLLGVVVALAIRVRDE
jgi:hypothetical protein